MVSNQWPEYWTGTQSRACCLTNYQHANSSKDRINYAKYPNPNFHLLIEKYHWKLCCHFFSFKTKYIHVSVFFFFSTLKPQYSDLTAVLIPYNIKRILDCSVGIWSLKVLPSPPKAIFKHRYLTPKNSRLLRRLSAVSFKKGALKIFIFVISSFF